MKWKMSLDKKISSKEAFEKAMERLNESERVHVKEEEVVTTHEGGGYKGGSGGHGSRRDGGSAGSMARV